MRTWDAIRRASAAGLPSITLRAGGELAIVTQGATQYDARAAVRLSGDVVAELEAVVAAI